jgi:hypothetical protein
MATYSAVYPLHPPPNFHTTHPTLDPFPEMSSLSPHTLCYLLLSGAPPAEGGTSCKFMIKLPTAVGCCQKKYEYVIKCVYAIHSIQHSLILTYHFNCKIMEYNLHKHVYNMHMVCIYHVVYKFYVCIYIEALICKQINISFFSFYTFIHFG